MKRNFLYSARFHLLVIIALTIIVYSNTLKNDYQLDDWHTVQQNSHIQKVSPIWRHFVDPSTMSILASNVAYRPLLPLTLSLTYYFFGTNVVGYHIFNIIFQIIAAIFLYLFARELMRTSEDTKKIKENDNSRIIAFFSALLFSVHPISGFPVNYICGRDNIMMVAFALISLYLYARMRRTGETAWGWALSLLFYALSILSKTIVLMFPLVIFCFEIFVMRESIFSKKTLARVGGFVLVAGAYLFFAERILHVSESANAFIGTSFAVRYTYLLTQFKLHLFHYFRNFIFPFPIRGLPTVQLENSLISVKVILGAIFIIGSLVFGLFYRKKIPVISFAIYSYWIFFAPTSSVLPIFQYVADRWMYPSFPFLCIIAGIVVFRYIPQKFSFFVASGFLAYISISSFLMNAHFKNAESFYLQSARWGTDEIGYMNLGRCYIGRDEEKVRFYYEKSLEVNPNYYLAKINYGLWLLDHGERERGLAMIREGVANAPAGTEAMSHYWLARALNQTGNLEEAFEQYKIVVRHQPNNNDYVYDAGFNAQALKRYKEALEYLDILHARVQNYKLSRFLTGWCYQAMGENEKAIVEYKIAEKYTPDYKIIYSNMGYAYLALMKYEEACESFEKLRKLDPKDPNAEWGLAECKKRANINR